MLGPLLRGSRNAVRNPVPTIAVIAILGVGFGMVVVMLAARGAVDDGIATIKSSIGNTVTVSPAGARGFLGGGEPLTNGHVETIKQQSSVTRVDATIDAQMVSGTDTSLQSPIEAGTLGGRGGRVFSRSLQIEGREINPADFKPPILAIGTNNSTSPGGMIGASFLLTSGELFAADSGENIALLGKTLAEKNALTVGSTFTAFNESVTVVGLYDAGNQFANNTAVFPLTTLQRLSNQVDQITSIVAHVDSVDNLSGVTTAIQGALGDAADVTSSEETVKNAVEPLAHIRTIAVTSLIGALIASAVVTLLTMVMIVRDRRKEIAVLKAIGSGDRSIITQFMTESVVLSLFGSVVGIGLGVALSNPILRALLSSSRGADVPRVVEGPAGGGAIRIAVGGFRAVQGAFQDLQAVVDLQLVAYGLLAAVVVAVIGSVIPAWLIAKVRPAEVLRSE